MYGGAAALAHERQARAFGLFYTVTTGAGAAAPLAFGMLGDAMDLSVVAVVVAVWVGTAAPVAFALRRV